MSPSVSPRNTIAAWLFALVVVLVAASILFPHFPQWITGVLAWGACLLLMPNLPRRQLIMVWLLVVLGIAGIIWGMASGKQGLINVALAQNIPLTGLLIAVSFLQLIAVRPETASEPLKQGPKALAQTLAGVHLFGAVINFSAVAIFADRLSALKKLTLQQAMALSQGFIVGATWSPFYGAMAAALIVSPDASLGQLMVWGFMLAAIGLSISWFTLTSKRHGEAKEFVGYPLHFESLWVPAVLAASVLLAHEWQPRWPVLAIIATFAPLVTIFTLFARDPLSAIPVLRQHVSRRLPLMNGELSLFMAAGVLSAGMSGAIAALELGLPFSRFGPLEAAIVLVLMNLLAWVGLHPVIMVSVLGPWLTPLDPDPNMLAMVFLMSWGVGLTSCPMSNTMLVMSGRYGLPFARLLNENRRYSFKMTAVCVAALYVYAWVKGIG